MDLIDRYIAAVSVLLPLRQREDIAAELRDALMNRAEEKEAALGRPLTRGEEADVLRAFGHPLAVAARYGRGRYLIGPELYPLYIFALKVLIAIVAAGAVIAGVVSAAVAPTGQPGPAIVIALGVFWHGAITQVTWLTAIVAVIERYNIRLKFLRDWNPENLPRSPRRPIIRRQTPFDHVGAIIVQTLFVFWWTRTLTVWFPYVTYIPLKLGQRLELARAPIWDTLYWPVLGLVIAAIVLHGLKLLGKAERSLVLTLDLICDIAAVIIASIALHAGHWVDVAGSGLSAAALAKIGYGVNIGLQVGLTVTAICAACLAAYHVWRLYEHGRAAANPGDQVAA